MLLSGNCASRIIGLLLQVPRLLPLDIGLPFFGGAGHVPLFHVSCSSGRSPRPRPIDQRIGAHMYLRIGVLCRDWNLECNAAQLDVWKAFDHVCHAAALRAMEEMGVGAHSRALIAKAWSLSKVSVQDWQPRPVNQ